MGTIRQSPLVRGKLLPAVGIKQWNLGLGCTSHAAKQLMEKIWQAELQWRRLQWEALRSRAQERKILTATQEHSQVPVKPQRPLIWLFTHLDANKEEKLAQAREDRTFQRKESRRRKEKVETDFPPGDGTKAQTSVQAQRRTKHLFVFLGWKEEEEAREQRRLRRLVKRRLFTFPEWREQEKEKVSGDVPAQKGKRSKRRPKHNTVVKEEAQELPPAPAPAPLERRRTDKSPARGREEEKLGKLLDPWPLEDTLEKRLARKKQHQRHRRDHLLGQKRGGLRLHLQKELEKKTPAALGKSSKRHLEEAEDIPSTKRQKTDHPSRVEPQLLDALCDLLGKLTLEGNDQSA